MLFNQPKRIKRSVDMSEGTDYHVDRYRILLNKCGMTASRGAVIDAVLSSLLPLSPKQAVKLAQSVERERKLSQSLFESTPESDEFTRNELCEEVKTWEKLKSILDVLADGLTPVQPMKKIPMANGMAILVPDDPDNWIVANPLDASFADKATIVEVRSGASYNVPHFIVFHNGEVSADCIDDIVIRGFPEFREVLNKRVVPQYDSEGNLLNAAEWDSSPAIGRFPAMPNNPVLGNPYGIEIISEGGEEGSN